MNLVKRKIEVTASCKQKGESMVAWIVLLGIIKGGISTAHDYRVKHY